ncbi:MAG: type II toxin-antitoxin system VapC family toxin [Burkholderiales bacterium]
MRILLDTQCWLWMLMAPERLSESSRALVTAAETDLILSAASAWEIAIKYGLRKLRLPAHPTELVPDLMTKTAVSALPVHHSHALHVARLPPHHRDPFDRLLIAQAQLEGLPILTADAQFERYEIEVIRA